MLHMDRLDFVITETLGFLTNARELYPEDFTQLNISNMRLIVAYSSVIFNTNHPSGINLYNIFLMNLRRC